MKLIKSKMICIIFTLSSHLLLLWTDFLPYAKEYGIPNQDICYALLYLKLETSSLLSTPHFLCYKLQPLLLLQNFEATSHERYFHQFCQTSHLLRHSKHSAKDLF